MLCYALLSYIGSSYGQLGLQNRIFKNHAKESCRNRESGKFLYELLAQSGTTWNFISLAVFQTTAPKQLVLSAEAIMCSLFFSYALKTYREFRLPELPHVDLDISVNRSDPLAIEGHVLTNQVHQKRHRTLRYCHKIELRDNADLYLTAAAG